MTTRSSRVGSELGRLLNEQLTRGIKDPRLKGVHVTEVDLSGDLSVARVYFSLLDPDGDADAAAEGLEAAMGFLRRKIGQEMRLRRVPEFRFTFDDSARRGMEISDLIARARSTDAD